MQPDSSGRGFERWHPASPERRYHPGEDITGSGAGQPGRRRRREAYPAIGRGDQSIRSLVNHHGAGKPGSLECPLRLAALQLAEQLDELALVRCHNGVVALEALRFSDMADGVGVNDDRRTPCQRQS